MSSLHLHCNVRCTFSALTSLHSYPHLVTHQAPSPPTTLTHTATSTVRSLLTLSTALELTFISTSALGRRVALGVRRSVPDLAEPSTRSRVVGCIFARIDRRFIALGALLALQRASTLQNRRSHRVPQSLELSCATHVCLIDELPQRDLTDYPTTLRVLGYSSVMCSVSSGVSYRAISAILLPDRCKAILDM